MSDDKFRIHLKGYEAVILYPALVTPAIVGPGGCLTVVLATRQNFYDDIYLKSGDGKKIGKNAARKLHSQLALAPWGTKEVYHLSEVAYEGSVRAIANTTLHMIYTSHKEALAQYGTNYQGWYLGAIGGTVPLSGYDSDGNTKLLGMLSQWAVKMYKEQGYTHLFQLNFKNINQSCKGMYELVYTYYQKLSDEDIAGMRAENPAVFDNMSHSTTKFDLSGFTDPDDDVLKQYLKNHQVAWDPPRMTVALTVSDYDEVGLLTPEAREKLDKLKQQNEALRKSRRVLGSMPKILRDPIALAVAKAVGDTDMIRMFGVRPVEKPCTSATCPVCARPDSKGHKIYYLGYPDRETMQEGEVFHEANKYLQCRHPVYFPGKWEGKIGVLGDLHLSSRQTVYKLVRPQIIPGAEPEDSPFIGESAHENLQSVTSLMQEIGKGCDMLAIVGDVYDHACNLDPNAFVESDKKLSTLWDLLGDKNLLSDFNTYPQYIDLLLFMSLVNDFYTQHNRPVIAVNGNHEAYRFPYGISPYIPSPLSSKEELFACNAGIPSDHNLPRLDATLLYGPKFGELGVSIEEGFNFKSECFDMFYCLLTPWADFSITYEDASQGGEGKERQDFLAFSWGKSESFINPAIRGAGTLPRADSNFDHHQITLLNNWTFEKKGKVVLLSHFPFVSYDTSLPLNDTGAWVRNHTASKYDWGSFDSLVGYRHIFEEKIDYTVSGHTHRPAIYTPAPMTDKNSCLVTARHKDSGNTSCLGPEDKFLVCGSAGPIAKQNSRGEFEGYGQLPPQGMILNLKENSITWVEYAVKPRFAAVVASMDAFENMGPFVDCVTGEPDSFRRGAGKCRNQFYFRFNHHFVSSVKKFEPTLEMEDVFSGVSLHCINDKKMHVGKIDFKLEKCAASCNRGDPSVLPVPGMYAFAADLGKIQKFEKALLVAGRILFMSVKFAKSGILVDAYDMSYPLCFPVNVKPTGYVDTGQDPMGIIKRDREYFKGSVAKHTDYEKFFA